MGLLIVFFKLYVNNPLIRGSLLPGQDGNSTRHKSRT